MVLHLKKLESPSTKDALCQEIGTVVLEKKKKWRFLISSMYFAICNYLPLEKGGAFHLNKLESSSPKDALCQV